MVIIKEKNTIHLEKLFRYYAPRDEVFLIAKTLVPTHSTTRIIDCGKLSYGLEICAH